MSAYSPIADYAVIGCTRSIALISKGGSIDWLCWPRFESPSVFARILDAERGGHFTIRPSAAFGVRRRYIGDSNVLETTFTTESGVARLVDSMPVMNEEEKQHRLTPFRQIARFVEVTEGSVALEAIYEPRPDYARTVPDLVMRGDLTICAWRTSVFHLRCDVPLTKAGPGTARAAFTLQAGECRRFALGFDDHSLAVFPHLDGGSYDETIAYWQQWSSQATYRGPYRDHVMRSALVLKLLTYAPSGGIVAAATTSLPERIGGIRNWDYRYCWLRDASFTVSALYDCGFDREGAAFLDWLLYSTRLTQPNLQILYDVFGESDVPERHLTHLSGYRGSKPVRVGNDAHGQFQLDVYGEVLGAVEEAAQRGEGLSRDAQRLMKRLANIVVKRWCEPDAGIWEKRGGPRQHIQAKIMAWSALDCAQRLVERGHFDADTTVWQKTKEEIRAYVLTKGFDPQLNAFIAVPGENEVDASLLYVARVGFLDANDPRMIGTIDAIRSRLAIGDLVYRYDTRTTEDGLPSGEGAFLACSFWLVEALALGGRQEEAHDLFQRLIARANDVGLLAEEIDPSSGAMLGNFPQALTHISLINAALCLEKKTSRVKAASPE